MKINDEEKKAIIAECNKIINEEEYRNLKLIDKITDLKNKYNLKTKIAHKQNELDILTLKEKRLKARVLQGVSNLDDRLDNLDSIRKAKEQKELDEVKATMLFFSILESVQEPAQKILKELL